jgi:nucleotide-binding universal stress UspA family protein
MKMLPFKKVLCPTDFSEPSYEALKRAQELALHFSAELCLVHAVDPIPIISAAAAPMSTGASAPRFNIPLYQQELKEMAEKRLQEVIDKKISKELKVRSMVEHGKAAEEIIRVAEEEKVDLIVIATHGETGFRQLVFGSVAEKVVQHASCPVLTIWTPR